MKSLIFVLRVLKCFISQEFGHGNNWVLLFIAESFKLVDILKAILSLGYEVFEQVLGSQLDPDRPIGNGGFWVTEIELRLLWPRTLGEAKPPISGTIYWSAHTNTHNYRITHTQTDTWTHKNTQQQKSRYTLRHRQTHRILLEAHNLTKNCLQNVYTHFRQKVKQKTSYV